MQSRAMRAALIAVALIAFGAAAFFLISSERQISERQDAVRAFDRRAREVTGQLANMRAAQQAYVAAGQGVAFWIPEVATLITTTSNTIDALRQSATSPDARRPLADAAANLAEFRDVDKRARDYLGSGDRLMAADMVFSDGAEMAAAAGLQLEAASLAEQQAVDTFEAGRRRVQAYVLGGVAVSALLIIALLALPGPRSSPRVAETADTPEPAWTGTLSLRDGTDGTAAEQVGGVLPRDLRRRDAVPALQQAAALCTGFGRVTDVDELNRLLAGVANIMDASGLVVWLGNTAGADLRPVLAHGYSVQALAQMRAVPRSADNAAAAAYRSGTFQIVVARPGASNGAIVAPILAPEGCIGALTAEMNGGRETSDRVQALGAIFAAQLAGMLTPSAPAAEDHGSFESKTTAG